MVEVVWFSRNEWLCCGFELWKDNDDNCNQKLRTTSYGAGDRDGTSSDDRQQQSYIFPSLTKHFYFLCVPIDFSSFFFLEMKMGKRKRRVKLKIKDVESVLLFLLFRLWVLVVQMEVSMVMVVVCC